MSVGGEAIEGLPFWAAGFTARADDFGFPVDGSGRIDVDQFLRVRGWDRTFAAGDVAAHRDGQGREMAMSAQIAVQAGDIAGRNALRLLRGDTLDRARLSHRGWVLDLDVKLLIETRGLGGLADVPG